MTHGILLPAFLLLIPCAAAAQDGGFSPLGVKVRAEPERVRLGEPFRYQVVLQHQKNQRFELNAKVEGGAFEMLAQKRDRKDSATEATTTFTLDVALFELGKKRLPDLPFEVVLDDGSAGQHIVKGVEVEGVSSLPPDAEAEGASLYDIHPPQEVAVRTYRLLWGLAAALGVVALAYVAYRLFKRSRAVALVPIAPIKPLEERTVDALNALASENLPAAGRGREFYFRLSEILRGYLGERLSFDALEQTTSELLRSLRALPASFPLDEFSRFAAESDLVKFAKAPVTAEECQASLEFGYRLIALTTPKSHARA